VVMKPYVVHGLPAAAMEGCRELSRIIEGARARFERGESSAPVARALADEIGLKEDVLAASTSGQTAQRRWGNVEDLFGMFARRDEQGKGRGKDLAEYLRFLTLRQDEGEEEAEDKVTLTTMHGTKGLEYRLVLVIGIEEGLLPHQRTLGERATDL